jgi:hypothetical protein
MNYVINGPNTTTYFILQYIITYILKGGSFYGRKKSEKDG